MPLVGGGGKVFTLKHVPERDDGGTGSGVGRLRERPAGPWDGWPPTPRLQPLLSPHTTHPRWPPQLEHVISTRWAPNELSGVRSTAPGTSA